MNKDDIEAIYNVDLSNEEERGRLLRSLEMTIEAMDKRLVNAPKAVRERATKKIQQTIKTIKEM